MHKKDGARGDEMVNHGEVIICCHVFVRVHTGHGDGYGALLVLLCSSTRYLPTYLQGKVTAGMR